MDKLIRNAKFWTAVADALVILLGYFVGKYAPQFAEDVKTLVITLQPIFAIVIAALFLDEQNAKRWQETVNTIASIRFNR